LLVSQSVLAQVPRPKPADSTGQGGALPQVFAMPTADYLGVISCQAGQVASGGTCVALTSGGGAGSFCGWVGLYNRAFGSRTSCNGNTLAMGNIPNCPASFAPSLIFPSVCTRSTQYACEGPAGPTTCSGNEEITPISFSFAPASVPIQVTTWNCPSSYTIRTVITGGGSSGEDSFYTCVKD
jgi:hypothetical protein